MKVIFLLQSRIGFSYSVKCRLINPCKSSIEIISKTILNNIINEEENRWKNTTKVLDWLNNILLKFDIVEFYSSILNKSLASSINFARISIKSSSLDDNALVQNSSSTW